MDFLVVYWQPILASAVLVFIASSILHMVIPLHKGDYAGLPGEDQVLESMRNQAIAPGEYMFPYCESMKDTSSPEMIEKYKQGPVGFMAVMPDGAPGIGKNLVQWFFLSVLVSIFAAYIASFTGIKTPRELFRLAATVAVLGYAASHISSSIWKAQKWTTTMKFIVDGTVYGLLTGGAFYVLAPPA